MIVFELVNKPGIIIIGTQKTFDMEDENGCYPIRCSKERVKSIVDHVDIDDPTLIWIDVSPNCQEVDYLQINLGDFGSKYLEAWRKACGLGK